MCSSASGGSGGQQDGDAVDDGIATSAAGAGDDVGGVLRERVTADGADEPAKGVRGKGGHEDRVLGAKY